MNPGRPDIWRALYPLDQWAGLQIIYICRPFWNQITIQIVFSACKQLSFSTYKNIINKVSLQIIYLHVPNPSARAGDDTRSIFKWILTGFNSEFSFSYTSCLTKAEEPSLPNYLPIAGGRIIGFIPFPRVIVLCEHAISLVHDLNSCRRVHFLRR